MKPKYFISIISSFSLGLLIYWSYQQYVTGINPFLTVVLVVALVILLTINVFAIKTANSKTKAFIIFIALGLVLPIGLLLLSEKDYDSNWTPRRYNEQKK